MASKLKYKVHDFNKLDIFSDYKMDSESNDDSAECVISIMFEILAKMLEFFIILTI